MSDTPSFTSSVIETFDNDIQRYYLDNGYLAVIIGGGDMRRPSMDLWANVMLETINHFITSKVYLLLDITHPKMGFTPYTSYKSNEILSRIPVERHLYLALVYHDSVMNNIIRIFLNRLKPMRHVFTYRAFNESERENALAWLREQRAKAPIE